MQKRSDPRHAKRREAVKKLFAWSFQERQAKNDLVKSVIGNLRIIDQRISNCAREWPIEKIGKIDLAILRLAVYELVISPAQPPKVVIDEAVELAKEFGGETTPGFVNGVLGSIFEEKEKNELRKSNHQDY